MPEAFYDKLLIIFYTVVPITLILLQILLATRKKLIWGFVVPVLWSALGTWIIISSYKDNNLFPVELLIFFLGGDFILFGIMVLLRYLKTRKNKSR